MCIRPINIICYIHEQYVLIIPTVHLNLIKPYESIQCRLNVRKKNQF